MIVGWTRMAKETPGTSARPFLCYTCMALPREVVMHKAHSDLRRPLVILLAFLLAFPASIPASDERARERNAMVTEQIMARGIKHSTTLAALRSVPRHLFVPAAQGPYAYQDRPLPIGYGQTISQPFMVAYMTELISPGPGRKVLEIGTGSGYQAAVLAELGFVDVYSIEIIPELAQSATQRLARLGFGNVEVKNADGYYGFRTIRPAPYPLSAMGDSGMRPRHIHFKVAHEAAGEVTTQMYFEGDPLIEDDIVMRGTPAELRHLLITSAVEEADATGSPELLIQMLDKLVDNAVDFSTAGDTVAIELTGDVDTLSVSVTNPGPPLPERMRSQLFDSMVSMREGKDSRHLSHGLYFAKLIAEGHGGSITADNIDGGVIFAVSIPRRVGS